MQLLVLLLALAAFLGAQAVWITRVMGAKFETVDVRFETSDAKRDKATAELKQHISDTMLAHIRTEHPGR